MVHAMHALQQIPPHLHHQQQHPHQAQHLQSPTHQPVQQLALKSPGSVGHLGGTPSGELEEINTKELAQRISAELKRYSIPQAIFAQRVLCRSQGTLSDLLRNPKPWSKLKSGRETFRRMWKWLQEPEYQRMSALRLAGQSILPPWFQTGTFQSFFNNLIFAVNTHALTRFTYIELTHKLG